MGTRVRSRGLILLVVLGMLSLFSLLAVTFVVFSGQSRVASLQMAGRDFRGTPPDRLLDQAIKQVVRGTVDTDSALWRQSLLDDLYGALEAPITTSARFSKAGPYPQNATPQTLPIPVAKPWGPQLYTGTVGQFLKIPLEWSQDLPLHHDALTGRVLTFLEGPLANQSLRIVRYIGAIDAADLTNYDAIRYSVLVDLSEIKDRVISVPLPTSPATAVTMTVNNWIHQDTTGMYALYRGTTGTLTSPYSILINAGPQNGTGIGLTVNSSNAGTTVTPDITPSLLPARAASTPPANQLQAPFNSIPDALLPNFSQTHLITRYGQTYSPNGDTDEPYDAADYNNFFLSLRRMAVQYSDDVTPAFHRPEVINYLAALDSGNLTLSSMSPEQFLSFLEVVQRASARPLSYQITRFPDASGSSTITLRNNPHFTGSSPIESSNAVRSPQLQFDWQDRTSKPEPQAAFDAWLRWNLRGSWDVDNDGDGIKDSVWVDLNYPLSTAPDGKLLKVLAAFYIEDMEGKIDINASGSQIQAIDTTTSTILTAFPLTLSDARYAYNTNTYKQPANYKPDLLSAPDPAPWPQGLGFGPADINMRHLFDDAQSYANVMQWRYNGRPGTDDDLPPPPPGGTDDDDDAVSRLIAHHSNGSKYTSSSTHVMRSSWRFNGRLPGLPVSTQSRIGFALDLLGNPILMDTVGNATLQEEWNDPYEASPLSTAAADRGISIAEWERIVRINDLDRSSLPRELEMKAGSSWNAANLQFLNRIRSISPRNVTLTTPRFTRTYVYDSTDPSNIKRRRVASFVEFVEEYMQRRTGSTSYPVVSNVALTQLFPMEFARNLPLNLNRPLGNGIDDNKNGEVDEPVELAKNRYTDSANSTEWDYGGSGSNARGDYIQNATDFDPGWDPKSSFNNSSPFNEAQFQSALHSGSRSRQLLARHLYCLAQLILPVDSSQNNAYIFPNQPTVTAVDNETRARILAQWAVNVVDFGDADAAMTRFSYDPNPFYHNGTFAPAWRPDGAHVVFGFEQPELLITESLATHDIRIRHRDKPKQGYDQIRVPEGSLFLEFYCPRSTAVGVKDGDNLLPGLPSSLYNTASGTAYTLNLATTSNDGTYIYPVWRVLLLEPNVDNGAPTTDSMTMVYNGDANTTADQYGTRAFNYSYQVANSPSNLQWRTATGANDGGSLNPVQAPKVDRVLWFTDSVTPSANNIALSTTDMSAGVMAPEARVYFHQTKDSPNAPSLQGGQYLVVGPRPTTYFGSKVPTNTSTREHRPNNHRITLMNNWVQMWQQDNTPAFWGPNAPPLPAQSGTTGALFTNFVQPCLTMVAGANLPATWTNPPDLDITQQYIGLNISEPTPDAYYPVPTTRVSTDASADPDNGAPGYDSISKDGYVDLSGGTASTSKDVFDGGLPNTDYFLAKHNWPISSQDNYPKPQTQKNWSAAVLQRLADPERGWHETLNPYITVDWHSIDLTVFSGEDKVTEQGDYYFATRAKTGQHTKVTIPPASSTTVRTYGNLGETFYSYETSFPSTPSVDGSGAGSVFFKKELLSEWYAGQTATSPQQARGTTASEFASLGYLNRSYVLRGYPNKNEYVAPYYVGAPGRNPDGLFTRTPDGLFFANRNYISALDLANVPISSAGTFAQEFYFEPTTSSPPVPRHRHTLDFEQVLGTAGTVPKTAAELLEVVGVGSPWPDAWKVANPQAMKVPAADLPGTALLRPYQPPFNFIPTYREPGRINLNTVAENLNGTSDPIVVYHALMGNAMSHADRINPSSTNVPFAGQLQNALTANLRLSPTSVLDSRTPNSGNPNLSSTSPTQFPGVFTSATGGYLFPLAALQRANPIDTTLFRRAQAVPPLTPTSNKRALDPSVLTSISPGGIVLNNSFTFNYPATRLANLTTDRSNVYAVRVTLGYFEYSPESGLGVEYGSEQGATRRNQAFYLIDRSIPVGFKSGEDNNTADCILVRRIIE